MDDPLHRVPLCFAVDGGPFISLTNRTATQQNRSKIEFSAFASILAILLLSAYIREYVRCSGGKVIYPINCPEFTVSKI